MAQAFDQPLYRRVQDAIVGEILRGGAPAGTRLPSLRRLARELGVSRITVEAAYEALEAQGLIGRHGSADDCAGGVGIDQRYRAGNEQVVEQERSAELFGGHAPVRFRIGEAADVHAALLPE